MNGSRCDADLSVFGILNDHPSTHIFIVLILLPIFSTMAFMVDFSYSCLVFCLHPGEFDTLFTLVVPPQPKLYCHIKR